MLITPRSLYEALSAVLALVGLLSRVRALVRLHIDLLHEGLAAELTGVLFIAPVDGFVPVLATQ